MHWTTTVSLSKESSREAARDFGGNLPEDYVVAGPRRALGFEIVTEVVIKLLERFNQQKIDGQPNRTTPVRISAEKTIGRLCRFVGDAVLGAVYRKNIWILLVDAR